MRPIAVQAVETRPAGPSVSTNDVSIPAIGTAAVVNYPAAGSGLSNFIGQITWSYDNLPTGGNLKIEDGSGNTIFSADITASGPGSIIFNPPKRGSANRALIVTLGGLSGVNGKLSCTQWIDGTTP